MTTQAYWRGVPHHPGVLRRTVGPRAAQPPRPARERVDHRLRPIPELRLDQLRSILKRSRVPFPDIDHIVTDVPCTLHVHGDVVAARRYTLYVEIDLVKDLGYDDRTIQTMYDGRTTVEEMISTTVYRDPGEWRRLLATI